MGGDKLVEIAGGIKMNKMCWLLLVRNGMEEKTDWLRLLHLRKKIGRYGKERIGDKVYRYRWSDWYR